MYGRKMVKVDILKTVKQLFLFNVVARCGDE
jgi:hypothetical protein